jgi:hypothetical protein
MAHAAAQVRGGCFHLAMLLELRTVTGESERSWHEGCTV